MCFRRDSMSRRTDRTPDHGWSGSAAAKPWMVKHCGRNHASGPPWSSEGRDARTARPDEEAPITRLAFGARRRLPSRLTTASTRSRRMSDRSLALASAYAAYQSDHTVSFAERAARSTQDGTDPCRIDHTRLQRGRRAGTETWPFRMASDPSSPGSAFYEGPDYRTAQIRLAHEMGHLRHDHTRASNWIYRMRVLVGLPNAYVAWR
jgi:hypothetical protein